MRRLRRRARGCCSAALRGVPPRTGSARSSSTAATTPTPASSPRRRSSARPASQPRSRASRRASSTRRSAPSATIRAPTSGTAAPSIRSCRRRPRACSQRYRSPRSGRARAVGAAGDRAQRPQGRRDLPHRHRLRQQSGAPREEVDRRAAVLVRPDEARVSDRTSSCRIPVTSGTGYTILATLVMLYGEDGAFDYLKRLAPNVVRYTQSGTAQGPSVARGEVAIGVTFVHEFVTQQLAGFPVDIAIPCEGTGDALGGMAILAGAPHPEEARAFYDWALTRIRAGDREPHAQPHHSRQCGRDDQARGRPVRAGHDARRRSDEVRAAGGTQAAARALAARNRRRSTPTQ